MEIKEFLLERVKQFIEQQGLEGLDVFKKLPAETRDVRLKRILDLFAIPNELRTSQVRCTWMVNSLIGIVNRAYYIKVSGIKVGDPWPKGGTVADITPLYNIIVDNGKRKYHCSPRVLLPPDGN